MGSLLDRIEQIAQKEGVKITVLERVIGASKGVLSRAINNKTDIQAKWIQSIVENYPLYSSRWLLTGCGEMLRDERPADEGIIVRHQPGMVVQNQDIPVFEMQGISTLSAIINKEQKPRSYLSLPHLPKCDGAIMMHGDRMSPELKSGDLVIFRRVKDLRQGIVFGNIYIVTFEIDGVEHIMVRYVEESGEADTVRLVGGNDKYAMEVPKDAIKEAAIIAASIRYRVGAMQ